MEIEQIEVTIGTDGKIKIQTLGFKGESCLAATEEVEKLLGNLVVSKDLTAEAYDKPQILSAERMRIHR